MPPKHRKRHGLRAQGGSCSSGASSGFSKLNIAQQQKRDKIEFFFNDFVRQGKERIEEIKREEEVLIAWSEKVCTLTLLQMPTAMRKMTMGEFLGTSGIEEAAVACANALSLDDTLEPQGLRKTSRKAKPVVELQESERWTRGMSAKARNKSIRKVPKTPLVASSPALKDSKQMNALPRSALESATSCKKVVKSNTIGVTPQCSKRFQRVQPPRSRCLSFGGEPLFMDGGIPFVNIPLTDGQSLCFVGDDLPQLDVSFINSDAVQTIQKLMDQLSVLCKKVSTGGSTN